MRNRTQIDFIRHDFPNRKLCESVEEAADVKAYDAAQQRLASGQDEFIPAAFAERILGGEQPVRVWREFRGLSVKELALCANMSAAYLSQIEMGRRRGTVATLESLARALNIDLDDLV